MTESQAEVLLKRIRDHMNILDQLRPIGRGRTDPRNLAQSAIFDLRVHELITIQDALELTCEVLKDRTRTSEVNTVYDDTRDLMKFLDATTISTMNNTIFISCDDRDVRDGIINVLLKDVPTAGVLS